MSLLVCLRVYQCVAVFVASKVMHQCSLLINMQLSGAPQEVRECAAVSMALYQLTEIRKHTHAHAHIHTQIR